MSDTALRAGLIRLAHARPDLRPHILPMVTGRVAMEFATKKQLENYLKKHPKADKSKHSVKGEGDKGKSKKDKGDIKFEVDESTIDKRRPSVSDDLSDYGSDTTVDKLKPEHREAIKEYKLEVVGNDAAQAVEIARKIKDGIKKGSDICKMNPPVCAGNKGLTRDKMPQIEGDKTVKQMLKAVKKDGSPDEEARAKAKAMVQAGADPDSDKTVMQQMIDHFKKNGVNTRRTKAPVGMLKATQSEIKAEKTYGMADSYLKGKFDNIGDSVVVSRDGHILDGHHRWAALLTVDPSREMNVQVIDMDMDDLLREAQAVPGVYKADFEGNPLAEEDQKAYKSDAKTKFKSKGKGKSRGTFTKNYRPKMESVMTKHGLTDDDAADVIQFSIDRPKKGTPQSPAELMRRFMAKAKPETKERMKGMTPNEFMVMLRAVLDQEEGVGKAASVGEQDSYNAQVDAGRVRLQDAVIRLAHANPTLRPRLASVLRDIHNDRAVRAALSSGE